MHNQDERHYREQLACEKIDQEEKNDSSRRDEFSKAGHARRFEESNVSKSRFLSVYLKVLRRHAWWCIIIPVIAAFVTGLWSISKPRMYLARSSLVPPLGQLSSTTGIGGAEGLKSQLTQMFGQGGGALSLYVDTLKSQTIADAIIDHFKLIHAYKVKDILAARRILKRRSVIVNPNGSSIVRVDVRDTDPNRAVAIANYYIEKLDSLNKTILQGEATNKRVFLGKRVAEIQKELGQIDNLKSREAKIKEMLYELLCREYEMAKIEEAKELPTIHVLDRASLPAEPVAKGTLKKSMVVGIGVFGLIILVVFIREGLL